VRYLLADPKSEHRQNRPNDKLQKKKYHKAARMSAYDRKKLQLVKARHCTSSDTYEFDVRLNKLPLSCGI